MIENHRLLAEGLTVALQGEGIDVAVTASSWTELLDHPALPVDVAVIEFRLDDGVRLATRVRELTAMGTATVVISARSDASAISSAMHAGALAFVAKSDSMAELRVAIRSAAAGGVHLAPHRAGALATSPSGPDPMLGRQEERALVLYAGGRSIREVALHMMTTEETVKSYIKRGRRKFRNAGVDIGTRILLRRHAVRAGWLSPE